MAVVKLQSFYKNVLQQSATMPGNEVGHFNMFRVEDLQFSRHKPVSYSRRDFYKITLVKGHSHIHYADQSVEVKGSVLVFTNPLIPYFWDIISEEQTGYVCIFTQAFFDRFGKLNDFQVFRNAASAIIPLKKKEAKNYEALFAKMHKELQGDYEYKYDLLRHLLMELIHGAQKMQPASGHAHSASNAAERIAGLFVELLERQFPLEFNHQRLQLNSPSEFAAHLNVHVNHLNKALKEITGQTTTQHIAARIVQEARVLLKSTSWSIAEIAWCLGFEEPNHFSGFFKTHTGQTPKHFRQHSMD